MCNFTCKTLLIEEALLFHKAIICCYNKLTTIKVYAQVPHPFTWYISQKNVDYLFPIVIYFLKPI